MHRNLSCMKCERREKRWTFLRPSKLIGQESNGRLGGNCIYGVIRHPLSELPRQDYWHLCSLIVLKSRAGVAEGLVSLGGNSQSRRSRR